MKIFSVILFITTTLTYKSPGQAIVTNLLVMEI